MNKLELTMEEQTEINDIEVEAIPEEQSNKIARSSAELTEPEFKSASPKVKKEKEKEEKKLGVQDLPGVGAATAEKLQSAGFHDLMSIAVASLGDLCESAGVSEAVARKMVNAARDSMKMGFETGLDILQKRKLVQRISIGSENFNELMHGGFETGAITECFGEFGSGKTQVGHLLAVNALKADPTTTVVYIDTENKELNNFVMVWV